MFFTKKKVIKWEIGVDRWGGRFILERDVSSKFAFTAVGGIGVNFASATKLISFDERGDEFWGVVRCDKES